MPLYSTDPKEEARMLRIRDAHPQRLREMAKSRQNDTMLPFHSVELTWIMDRDHRDDTYPLLEPNEYWPLIASLAFQLRQARHQLGEKVKK